MCSQRRVLLLDVMAKLCAAPPLHAHRSQVGNTLHNKTLQAGGGLNTLSKACWLPHLTVSALRCLGRLLLYSAAL